MLAPAKLQAVILDLDGVLADSHLIHHAAWKALLEENGRRMDDSKLDFILQGRKRADILRYCFGDLPREALEQLGRRKEEHYQKLSHTLRPVPGVLEFLDELEAAAIPKAVATSAAAERTQETLRRFGLEGRFAAVVSSGDVEESKPDPAIFRMTAERLGVEPRAAVVIEDSVAGVQAAKAAGMTCVAYARGGRHQALREAGADAILSAFTPGVLECLHEAIEKGTQGGI
ncbi:MAG: HAD family phosphatase [Acidobacteria bacterium]|nr:HAD family phosphatase [Acidobacteriota bacterium]